MAYGYGNPGTWGTAGTTGYQFQSGNPGVWGTAGTTTTKKKKSVASILDAFDPAGMAQEDTDRIINSLLDSVRQQQELERQAAQRDAQDALARGQALAYGLQQLGLSNNIQQIFQNAAANQGSLAQGFSGDIKQQAQAQADAQAKALTGTGQEGAVRNEGAGMGNVTYGLGGYIPGTSLNTIGAAFSADAALQPGFATQFGALEQALKLKQYADQAPERNAAINEVLARKPELFQQFLTQNRQIQAQKQAAKAEAAQQAYARWKDQRDFKYQQSIDRANAKLAGIKLDDASAQAAADSELAWYKAQHPNTNLQSKTLANGQVQWFDPQTGQKVGPPVGPTKKTSGGKTNGLTAGQYATNVQKATVAARDLYYGTKLNDQGKRVNAADIPGFDAANADSYGDGALGYQQALNKLVRTYRIKASDAAKILNDLYDTPGEDGRPWFSYDERKALKQQGFTNAQIRKAMRPEYRDTPLGRRMLAVLGRV